MSPAITATPTRTLSVCVPCLTGTPHDRCDTDTAAIAQRVTITAAPARKAATR